MIYAAALGIVLTGVFMASTVPYLSCEPATDLVARCHSQEPLRIALVGGAIVLALLVVALFGELPTRRGSAPQPKTRTRGPVGG